MKTHFLVVAALALSLPALAQDAQPLAISQVKLRADAPVLFAPRGWKIEKRVSGDLNRDKMADLALVLVQNKPVKDDADNPAPRQRALVVLLKEGKGWHRVGFNNSLLLGTRDGGAFYGVVETPVNVSIKNGVLVVNEDNGSREVTETTHKFRFDARQNRVYLIGLEQTDRDRATGQVRSVSTNYLTGVQKITTFNAENDKEKHQTKRVSRNLRTLESVKVDERYSG